MKEWKVKFLIILIFVFAIYIIGSTIVLRWAFSKDNEKCINRGLPKGCKQVDYCMKDCEDLGKEYFKYDSGGFGSSECWCKLNGDIQQVW